jgi:S-formylglutathione hydrolase FrmB
VAYALALVLVLSHEADRLADWLSDLGRNGLFSASGYVWLVNAAADLKGQVKARGLDRLAAAEESFLRALTPEAEVGNRPLPAPLASPTLAGAATRAPDSSPPASSQLATSQPVSSPETPVETRPVASASEEYAIPLVTDRAASQPSYQTILLTGDSMMLEGLGPPLQKLLAKIEGLTVSRAGKYATGLCRLDAFDWFSYFETLLESKKPDLTIISLGANDTQDIVENGQRHLVTTDSWRQLYGQRVSELLKIAEDKKVAVFWIGLPIMGREPYNARAAVINEVAADSCQKAPNCQFFDTWEILAEKGRYATFIKIDNNTKRVRAKDLIHLTEAGGKIVAEAFWLEAQNWATLGPKTETAPQVASLEGPAETRKVIDDISQVPNQLAAPAPVMFSPDEKNEAEKNENEKNEAERIELPDGEESPSPFAALAEATLDSKALGQRVSYQVYAPKGQGPWPAVFLLPGVGENHLAFGRHFGDLLWALAEKHGLALIAVDSGGHGWYLDSPVKARSAHMTFFFQELLPDVLAKFPLRGDSLGLLGISMGGHGALTFALAQPGRFRAVSALSAVTDLSSHGDGRAINKFLKLPEVLGPYKEKAHLWRAASAYWQTRSSPQTLGASQIYLTVGRSDALTLAENRQYHRLLKDLGVDHLYKEDSGAHDWDLWARQLPDHLKFLAQYLKAGQ